MGRIVAIDYGAKRCGVAATDPLQIIAGAIATIDTKQILTYLKDYLSKEQVDVLVVGKPMRLDGSDTHSTAAAEKFVTSLRQLFPTQQVEQVDERFTSAIAQRSLLEMGLKKKDRQKKENIDQVSAALILQTYLEMKNIK
ncbi:MAG: Holliday junction resolvase RuvX [Bacteroidota bacterium]|jgi:putative Holliday junction resolvase|nr:Holliday junction resolvase RuvX [Sphingobacteriales bacterium]